MGLEIGSIYHDGIVIFIDKNKHGLIISKYEKITNLSKCIDLAKNLPSGTRLPTKIEMELYIDLVKKNKSFKEFNSNTECIMPSELLRIDPNGKIIWWWALSNWNSSPVYENFWCVMYQSSFFRGKTSLLSNYSNIKEKLTNFQSRLRFVHEF
jgi:hypothetical protein